MLSETKIDDPFGDPFRIDRNWRKEFCFMLGKIFWQSF